MVQLSPYSGDPDDRYNARDLWAWLKEQPQDAWLLWMRTANWDNADQIFDWMLDDPNCDLAIVSWLFWMGGADDEVINPGNTNASLTSKILRNLEKGYYANAGLYYNRVDVIVFAHEYIKNLKEIQEKGIDPPFALPRQLCGPFNGRRARIPDAYDPETEEGLRQILDHMDARLPRSEDAHWRDQTASGNLEIIKYLTLPKVPDDPLTAFAHLDDLAYMEAIFGRHKKYLRARKMLHYEYLFDASHPERIYSFSKGNHVEAIKLRWKYGLWIQKAEILSVPIAFFVCAIIAYIVYFYEPAG